MTATTTAAERITRARTALLMDHPFFGALALRLAVVERDAAAGCRTLGTDGTILAFNGEGIAEWTDAELRWGVAHEVMHCALAHPYERTAGRDWRLWNQATDYVVNRLLAAEGMTCKGSLLDAQYAGMSAEQVYALLSRQRQNDPQSDGSQAGKPADEAPGPENGPSGAGDDQPAMDKAPMPGKPGDQPAPGEPVPEQMTAEDWQVATEQAAAVARKAGKIGGGTDRAITASRQPVADWRAILREFVEQAVPSDFSWSTPNRAVLPMIYAPAMIRENCPGIDVYVDTSGSTVAELPVYARELTAILHEVRPEYLRVVYCDARVQGTDRFEPDDPRVELRAPGGGGTLFQPAFDWAKASGELPAAAVYFTDLEGPAPSDPGYPVLWVTTAGSRRVGPFGRTVRVAA